jgi:hypothetical protein
MTKEAATAAVAARSTEPLSASTHWALSGLPKKDGAPAAGAAPAGKPAAKPAAKAAAPEAPAPKCLEGIRRAATAGQPASDKPAC